MSSSALPLTTTYLPVEKTTATLVVERELHSPKQISPITTVSNFRSPHTGTDSDVVNVVLATGSSSSSLRDELLQMWKGIILECTDEVVTAKIIDQSRPENASELIDFDIDEFSEDDRPLVQTGAVFYLSVRYEQTIGRPRQRVTRLRVRRLAGFSIRDLEAAAGSSASSVPWD
ncbi:MAG: hypothetical protein ACREV5_13830 [Steroidobacter sp.]